MEKISHSHLASTIFMEKTGRSRFVQNEPDSRVAIHWKRCQIEQIKGAFIGEYKRIDFGRESNISLCKIVIVGKRVTLYKYTATPSSGDT